MTKRTADVDCAGYSIASAGGFSRDGSRTWKPLRDSQYPCFGSFARGEAEPQSDIDLLVEYVPGKGGFAFVEFCEAVETLLGRKVDVITDKSLPALIRDRVLAQAVPL